MKGQPSKKYKVSKEELLKEAQESYKRISEKNKSLSNVIAKVPYKRSKVIRKV